MQNLVETSNCIVYQHEISNRRGLRTIDCLFSLSTWRMDPSNLTLSWLDPLNLYVQIWIVRGHSTKLRPLAWVNPERTNLNRLIYLIPIIFTFLFTVFNLFMLWFTSNGLFYLLFLIYLWLTSIIYFISCFGRVRRRMRNHEMLAFLEANFVCVRFSGSELDRSRIRRWKLYEI
jgi:hypothetical protein